MKIVLQVLSGLIGFYAAYLWFQSAALPLPLAPGAAFGGTSPSDPFNVALHQSALLNQQAATETAVAIILQVIATLIDPVSLALTRLLQWMQNR
jgi:hypothetical protein